jgi:hypothetical protein
MNVSSRWFLFAALSVAPVFAASSRIEREVAKTFTVASPGILRVETEGGSIRITPSSDSTVRVTARQRIKAGTEADADEVLQKLELRIEQNGNDIFLRSKYERRPRLFAGSWPPVQVDFVLSVPAGFAAELSTSGGGITAGDGLKTVDAETSGGSVKLGRVDGPVEVRTSGGGITLDEAGGPVDLKTSGGSITVGKVAGSANLSTSGGGIRIDSVQGAVRATTSGGSIRAAIAGPLKDECILSTSGGGVKVAVEKSAAFQLDASSSGGGVNADGITLTLNKGSQGRNRLAGAVNGGGPLLKLRTSGGSIDVAAH